MLSFYVSVKKTSEIQIFKICKLLPAYISQVKCYLQVPPEVVCKAGVDIKNLQQVVPQDAVQVTIGDGVDI